MNMDYQGIQGYNRHERNKGYYERDRDNRDPLKEFRNNMGTNEHTRWEFFSVQGSDKRETILMLKEKFYALINNSTFSDDEIREGTMLLERWMHNPDDNMAKFALMEWIRKSARFRDENRYERRMYADGVCKNDYCRDHSIGKENKKVEIIQEHVVKPCHYGSRFNQQKIDFLISKSYDKLKCDLKERQKEKARNHK